MFSSEVFLFFVKNYFFYEVKVVHTKIIHRPSLRRRGFIVTKKFTETNPLDYLFIKQSWCLQFK